MLICPTLPTFQVFANALRAEGFDLEFQGTENHLMLIDLKSFVVKDGNRLDGETAARLLENVGIICNKVRKSS